LLAGGTLQRRRVLRSVRQYRVLDASLHEIQVSGRSAVGKRGTQLLLDVEFSLRRRRLRNLFVDAARESSLQPASDTGFGQEVLRIYRLNLDSTED
jgi:hypothetical protein